MPNHVLTVIAESDRAKAPDFSIPRTVAEHHDAAARHYQEAARCHRVAAKLDHTGHHDKAAHSAYLAYAHHIRAERHAIEAAKATAKLHIS